VATENPVARIFRWQRFPATGQTTCWDSAGTVIDCAGTGQDGDIRAGAPLRYRDNGNGTITDLNTRLTWEKKSDDGGRHDWDNSYNWDQAFAYVRELNNSCARDASVSCSADADCAGVGGRCGFAGRRDWYLPNVKQLQSIVNYEKHNENHEPAVSPAFHTGCEPGATVLTGSCTKPFAGYWSSTSYARIPNIAWNVHFGLGFVTAHGKNVIFHVRAVRGGL
jgi:hypothetical protein